MDYHGVYKAGRVISYAQRGLGVFLDNVRFSEMCTFSCFNLRSTIIHLGPQKMVIWAVGNGWRLLYQFLCIHLGERCDVEGIQILVKSGGEGEGEERWRRGEGEERERRGGGEEKERERERRGKGRGRGEVEERRRRGEEQNVSMLAMALYPVLFVWISDICQSNESGDMQLLPSQYLVIPEQSYHTIEREMQTLKQTSILHIQKVIMSQWG